MTPGSSSLCGSPESPKIPRKRSGGQPDWVTQRPQKKHAPVVEECVRVTAPGLVLLIPRQLRLLWQSAPPWQKYMAAEKAILNLRVGLTPFIPTELASRPWNSSPFGDLGSADRERRISQGAVLIPALTGTVKDLIGGPTEWAKFRDDTFDGELSNTMSWIALVTILQHTATNDRYPTAPPLCLIITDLFFRLCCPSAPQTLAPAPPQCHSPSKFGWRSPRSSLFS